MATGSMIRVLHVISSLDGRAGGPTTVVKGIAIAQAKSGLNVTVISTYSAGDDTIASKAMQDAGVRVQLIGPAVGRLMLHREIRLRIEEAVSQAEIVHIHAIWEDIQRRAAITSRKQGVPYVITPHGMLTSWSLSQSKWLKHLFLALRVKRNLSHASAIHFTSESERDASLVLRIPTIIESIGLDLTEFVDLPPKGTFRSLHPQTLGKPLIIFLGRIHPGKGLEHLIPALMHSEASDAILVIIGPDSENFKAVIDEMVVRFGLQNRVIFTGMLRGAQKVAALSDGDLFCLPSDHENFGLSIVEALAAGLPVVLSRHVGIWREIIDAGLGGVADQDAESLGQEIAVWLRDPARRRAAADKARPFVWKKYDWLPIAERWRGHYTEVINLELAEKLKLQ